MKNHDFKKVTKLIILYLVFFQFGSVDTAAIEDCPHGQVLHFNPETNKGLCCRPVPLPKGYGYKSCTSNGMKDTIEVCPKEPVQQYQWDDTTTASEATCTAEMQCLDDENRKIEKCDKLRENCHSECVCNFPGGYCGTEYFNCNPFPVDCPKEDVQEDCSCWRSIQSPGSESKNRNGKSDLDIPNPMNPDASFSKLPSSSAGGKSDEKKEGDQTPDVGVIKKETNYSNQNNNATTSETKQEEYLSSGSIIGITVAVIVVIGGPILVCALWKDRYKRLWDKCRKANEDSERGRYIGEFRCVLDIPDNPAIAQGTILDIPDGPAITEGATLDIPDGPAITQGATLNIPIGPAIAQGTTLDIPDGPAITQGATLNIPNDPAIAQGGTLDIYNGPAIAQERRKPVQEVRPFYQNSLQDQDEEAQSLQRHVSGQDDPAGQELETEPFLSGGNQNALPQDVNGAQPNLFEELQFNSSDDWTTLGSSLFHSCDDAADQTDVKVMVNSEILSEEEGHHSGAVDNSGL